MEESVGFFQYFWTIFWSIFWLFLLIAWFWVLITVVADIFRSKDIGGVAKAAWLLFVILIPWLGVLAYILTRGDKMTENNMQAAAAMESAQRDYIRGIAGTSVGTELEKLSALKEQGVITQAEFDAQKKKLLDS